MEPILELAIELPPRGSGDLVRALHHQLRAAVLDGRLQPGLRLPPSRALATRLEVSRNTVMAAYDRLLSEGYLEARTGAGTFVVDVRPSVQRHHTSTGRAGPDRRLAPYWRGERAVGPGPLRHQGRYDLRTGYPDIATFPFDIWQRLSARSARSLAKQPRIAYEPQGRMALREAIARHVSFTRAVACTSDDVVVTTGTRQAVDLIGRVLVKAGETRVAVEDPCYPPVRRTFASAGARVVSVPVDADGLLVEELPADTRLISISPSHQFPLGVTLSARRRAALLDFARTNDAVIIEDDYDGEFRFQGRSPDALQTLDRSGSVFYVGTFAKAMFTEMRVGFVVAPPWARRALLAAKQTVDGSNPILVQDALAGFIADGHLARHIRKMRAVYAERRATLVEAIERHCGGRLRPIGSQAGVHLAVELTGQRCPTRIAARAANDGITVETLDRYAHRKGAQTGLVIGYGLIATGDVDPAIRLLARCLD